jgi:hypothetical protein
VSFSSDGTLEQDQSGRIRIQSEAAIKQFGVLTFSYVADLEHYERIDVQVRKAGPHPGRGRAASRWSAPGPGKRTRREDRAPSHRPQMSSGRLFLDRVARQQSSSLLHRHEQHNTHSQKTQAKGDISTLPARGHFYFALTTGNIYLTAKQFRRKIAETGL